MPEPTLMPDPDFWKRKLAAFLHDPPDKCFDLHRHEESALQFMAGAGIGDADQAKGFLAMVKAADHFSAAAERFVFPKRKCSTTFDGCKGACFIHPLGGGEYVGDAGRSDSGLRERAGELHGILQAAVGGIETEDWRKKFFLYWRRWLENAVTSDQANAASLALFPADSRIPDHSIWTHMAVTSALAGCLEVRHGASAAKKDFELKPALLLFQLGPVQDFIAQARSTRDLWSGSYLLSWLIAHAMKAVTDQVGPDAVIFPSLRGNGIFDALHRDEMYAVEWQDRHGKKMSTWQRMLEEKRAGQDKKDMAEGGDPAARWPSPRPCPTASWRWFPNPARQTSRKRPPRPFMPN